MSKLSGYNLECPSKQSALDVYTRAFDRNRANVLWNEACKATELVEAEESLENLEKIFGYLAAQKGPVGVYGMSLKVRLMTYKNIVKVKARAL